MPVLELYDESLNDHEVLELNDEIAVTTALVRKLIGQMETSEPESDWGRYSKIGSYSLTATPGTIAGCSSGPPSRLIVTSTAAKLTFIPIEQAMTTIAALVDGVVRRQPKAAGVLLSNASSERHKEGVK